MDVACQAPLTMEFSRQEFVISYSRGSSRLWGQTPVSCISCIGRQILYQLCHLRNPNQSAWTGTWTFGICPICYCWLAFSHSFSVGSDSKEYACRAGDVETIPGSGRSPGEANGYPLQYSCLRIPWTEEPGGLQFLGSQTVRLNWATNT